MERTEDRPAATELVAGGVASPSIGRWLSEGGDRLVTATQAAEPPQCICCISTPSGSFSHLILGQGPREWGRSWSGLHHKKTVVWFNDNH